MWVYVFAFVVDLCVQVEIVASESDCLECNTAPSAVCVDQLSKIQGQPTLVLIDDDRMTSMTGITGWVYLHHFQHTNPHLRHKYNSDS